MQHYDLPDGSLYIGGEWRTGRGAEITSRFPADGSLNRVLRGASAEDVDLAIERAEAAVRDPAWRGLRPHERALFLYRIADGIAASRRSHRLCAVARHRQDADRDSRAGA